MIESSITTVRTGSNAGWVTFSSEAASSDDAIARDTVRNTGSASVTGFEVRKAGLSILNADGKTGNTGTTPIDAAVSRNSQFLYTLTAGSHTISAFTVRQDDGSLSPVNGAAGLPVGTVGLAAK